MKMFIREVTDMKIAQSHLRDIESSSNSALPYSNSGNIGNNFRLQLDTQSVGNWCTSCALAFQPKVISPQLNLLGQYLFPECAIS